MPYDCDILIAGAGPAGCSAAYDLARCGKRVLLLDKRTFPRPKACACGLTRKTFKALRYSVDPIIERVCHEIVLQHGEEPGAPCPDSGTWDLAHLPQVGRSREVLVKTRKPICAMAVRERFDHFCLRQTLAAGRNGGSVELLKIEGITNLRELPTHIELNIATADGPRTLTAPVLIGADGSNGQTRRLAASFALKGTGFSPSIDSITPDRASAPEGMAQQVQEPGWYTNGFALEATVPYADLPSILPGGDAPRDLVFDFSPLPGGYGWLFPKGNHINIGVGAFAPSSPGHSFQKLSPSAQDLKQVTRSLLLDYASHKLGVSTLAHITGQQLGMGGHTYVPHGRVLLAGDAAGLVDPLTGEGIHSAIVSGQAAAAAVLSCSSTNRGASCPASGTWDELATLYAANLRPLQQTLAFSHRAAHAFYADPDRGFRAMRLPILRSLILKTYADGLPHTRLLTALSKLV